MAFLTVSKATSVLWLMALVTNIANLLHFLSPKHTAIELPYTPHLSIALHWFLCFTNEKSKIKWHFPFFYTLGSFISRSPLSRICNISRFCALQAKHVTLWSILTNCIYEYLFLDGGEEHGDEIGIYPNQTKALQKRKL